MHEFEIVIDDNDSESSDDVQITATVPAPVAAAEPDVQITDVIETFLAMPSVKIEGDEHERLIVEPQIQTSAIDLNAPTESGSPAFVSDTPLMRSPEAAAADDTADYAWRYIHILRTALVRHTPVAASADGTELVNKGRLIEAISYAVLGGTGCGNNEESKDFLHDTFEWTMRFRDEHDIEINLLDLARAIHKSKTQERCASSAIYTPGCRTPAPATQTVLESVSRALDGIQQLRDATVDERPSVCSPLPSHVAACAAAIEIEENARKYIRAAHRAPIFSPVGGIVLCDAAVDDAADCDAQRGTKRNADHDAETLTSGRPSKRVSRRLEFNQVVPVVDVDADAPVASSATVLDRTLSDNDSVVQPLALARTATELVHATVAIAQPEYEPRSPVYTGWSPEYAPLSPAYEPHSPEQAAVAAPVTAATDAPAAPWLFPGSLVQRTNNGDIVVVYSVEGDTVLVQTSAFARTIFALRIRDVVPVRPSSNRGGRGDIVTARVDQQPLYCLGRFVGADNEGMCTIVSLSCDHTYSVQYNSLVAVDPVTFHKLDAMPNCIACPQNSM